MQPESYVQDKNSVKRSYVPTEPKTWSSQGVSISEKIEAVRKECNRSANALELQHLFGLRTKESCLLKPHSADKGHYLLIEHGAKGGRMRTVPIETDAQRALIEQLKTSIHTGESLVPREKTYYQFNKHYYYVLSKHNISRKDGITAHGLRHEHLNKLYSDVTGHKSTVEGGNLHNENQTLDSHGRQLVSERAGHSREQIASAYLGGKS
tara:strand:+ start:4670 stop:5296 length:627 start_codon:yes stop_codon:yes gene_type:complete